MRKHSFIQYIAVIAAFVAGIFANVAARVILLPFVLPAKLQSLTGLFALLIQILISGVIVLAIGYFNGRRNQ